MILETKCIQEGVWIGLIPEENACLCSVGSEVFVVGAEDYLELSGCRYPTEQHVLGAFEHYALQVQQLEEERKRLSSLARRYEFKDNKVIPYEEPF